MNKNRYKLIFSRSKSCLVPVAEFINTVTEKSQSENNKGDRIQEETHRLSFISSAITQAIKSIKYIPMFLLPVPIALANNPNVEVDEKYKDKTTIKITDNKVILVDIAKPEHDGISDNRFKAFNVENGAVFKNNKNDAQSTLVGHLEKNPHLDQASAKAILTQVTGQEATSLKGGLEVLGDKADLLIVNPNGVTINGVQTFNTDRFVVSTSNVIDPKNGLTLNVTQGNVTITSNGLSTEGLKYVDIVAKKIEQKGVIKPNTTVANAKAANITFIAGSSNYNVTTNAVTSQNVTNNEDVILSGGDTGSMYGDHIKFIVTDSGAGVNHQGVILSESDIVIEAKDGDVKVNTLHSKKEISVKNSKDFELSKEAQAEKISVNSKKVKLKKAAIKANDETNITATDIVLEDESKIRSQKTNLNATNVSIADHKSELLANQLSIQSKSVRNNGTISALNTTVDTDYLHNRGSILAKQDLNISVIGEPAKSYKEQGFQVIRSNYTNLGAIQSNGSATLNFKNNTSFSAIAHTHLPNVRDRLTINANYFEVEIGQAVELLNNLTVNAQHFINDGRLTSSDYLDISSTFSVDNNGLLGAGKGYKIKSLQADISNGDRGTLHSLGTSLLDSEYKVINNGQILSKDKLTIRTRHLINNATLVGDVINSTKDHYNVVEYYPNAFRYDVYTLDSKIKSFDHSQLKLKNVGQIRSENGFEFEQKELKDDLEHGIDNFGIINIRGQFHNNGTTRIHNGVKGVTKDLIKDYFDSYDSKVTVKFKPYGRYIFAFGVLAGEASQQYQTIGQFLDHLLKQDETIRAAGLYSGYYHEYLKALKNVDSPQLQNALTQVLGQNWDTQKRETLQKNWEEAKKKTHLTYFYPDAKAKILADSITGNITQISNGPSGESGSFDNNVQVGEHSINLPKVNFKTFINQELENNSELDISILLDLLSDTNLFIDRSVQLVDPKNAPQKPQSDDDKNDWLYLTEEERAEVERQLEEGRQREIQQSEEKRLLREKQEAEKRRLKEEAEKAEREKQEKERKRKLEEEKKKAEERKRQEEQRKQEIEKRRQEEEARKQREAEEKARLEEKYRREQEELKKERETEELKRKQKELEERHKREQKELEEKRLKEEQERQAQEKARKEQERKQREEAERKALEEQARLIEAERQRQKEEERKQREELERKERELAEKHAKEAEELRLKQEQDAIAAEKRRLELERKKEEQEQAQIRALVIAENSPRVQVDPLYHTRVKYIKQDDYVGSSYFFNQVVTPTDDTKKVKVIGDNYFEHQLITRTIEKKVDNRLSLKYDLKNNELVKRLMDNAAQKSKSLKLEVGKALTKEQQENLDEDIIWYVQSEVNGQQVFIPQVYLAKETLENAKKSSGQGNSVIRAKEIALKTENVDNNGVISAEKLDIEAKNKIRNSGDILAGSDLKLKGHKGIEVLSRVETDDKGNTVTRQANIASQGHLHLETDLDSNIDLRAANVEGKTGFIKAKDVNVKESYNTSTSHKNEAVISRLTGGNIGLKTETKSKVDAVGSNVKVDHLHLAVEGDLNQSGSKINTERTTGIVKGNVNTQAGKHLESVQRTENVVSLEISGRASGLGQSVSANFSEQDGFSTDKSRSDASGVNLEGGLAFRRKTEKETSLTHTNSELNAKSGELHVLGNADIGGVDINKGVEVAEVAEKATTEKESESVTTQVNKLALQTVDQVLDQKNKALQGLSTEQIEQLMAEKDAKFYEEEKQKKDEGFTLSAKSISSTKVKDEHSREAHSFGLKIGAELEAHSAILDAASGVAKEVLDAKAGLKQDGTIVLQHASEAANLVTGDLVGASGKRKLEISMTADVSQSSSEVRSHLGGKTTLVAREGDLTLKNVESNANSQLTLTAKENVNLNAGKSENVERSASFTQKLYEGSSVSCGVMSQGCAVGVSSGFDANINVKKADGEHYQNSQLKGSQIVINAGKDLNLKGANIEASQVNLDVAGKTRIESVQDRTERSEIDVNVGASGGASINTSLQIKPTGSITAGVGYEYESSKKVAQQSGITADRIVGTINDLDLKAGHIVDRSQGKDLTIKGEIKHENLQDYHHKDGGSFGGTVGINERGTAQINLRGGRTEQIHYDATQKSTLSAGDKGSAEGLNRDISQAKSVQRDDRIASSKFEFEVLDLVELGQKAKNKLTSSKASSGTTVEDGVLQPRSKDPKASAEAVYEEIAPSAYDKVGDANADFRRAAPTDDGIYSEVQQPRSKAEAKAEPIYEEIAPSPYGTVGDANADFKRNKPTTDGVYSEVQQPRSKAEAKAEPIYEEIAPSPYGTVGDANADFKRNKSTTDAVYSEVQQPKNKVESVYAEVTTPSTKSVESVYAEVGAGKAATQEGLYAQVDKSPQAKAKADARTADIPLVKNVAEASEAAPALPKRPQLDNGDTNVEQTSQANNRAKRALPELPQQSAEVGKAKPAVEGDYAEIPAVTEQAQSNNRAKRALPELPQQSAEAGKAKPVAEGDYAEIPAVTEQAQSNNRAKRALPELPQQSAESGKAKPAVEGDYAEIPAVTEQAQSNSRAKRALPELPQQSAEVGKAKPAAEGDYAEIPAVTEQAQSNNRAKRALPELPQQSAESGKAKPAVEGDYAEIPAVTEQAQSNSRAKRALPELPQQSAEVGKAKPAAEGDYAEIPAVTEQAQSNNRAKRALPELPSQNAEVGKAKPAAEGDYAEIPAVTEQSQSNNRAKRALPELPQQSAEAGKAKPAAEGDYAEIPALTPRAKSSGASDYEEIPNLAPKAKVETETANTTAEQPKVTLTVDDGLYAKVDKSPEAKAKAEARTAEIPLTKKAVAEADDIAPTLPKRPQAAQIDSVEVTKTPSTAETASVVETVAEQTTVPRKAKAEKEESGSWFDKVKRFFKGSSESSNAKKAAKPEPKAAQDETPNYDNLADNLNLKGLVELENQRNTDFSEKVLKNPEFLAEAKEAAKKYIPEATIKQMGDSPEFNDILTEGARKVEQRINDAVTFKPTVDEFNAIQGLVKQLPKGSVLDDINARTDSITDALASTSKTIQKTPELKELIRGAIDNFLKESAGQDLTVEMIEKLNKGLRPDEQGDFTLYKKETLTKENAVFSSPEASKIQLAETVAFINKAKADNIEPSVLAGLVYQRLIAYHPFAEGNGRMARVIVNKILLDAGYPPFTKFSDAFETQIIPQTNSTAKSATSSEVVSEFLRELGQKTLPAGSEPIVRQESESKNLQKVERSHPLVEATLNNAKPAAEGDYAEIPAVTTPQTNSRARRALPEVPSQNAEAGKAKAVAESDYAEIPALTPRAKSSVESDYAEIPAEISNAAPKAKVETETATTEQPKVALKVDDGLYAKVDKSPEAKAKAEARTAEIPLTKKAVAEVEEAAPALPKRPQAESVEVAKTAETQAVVETVAEQPAAVAPKAKAEKEESGSWFDKVKRFFKGGSESSNAKKAAKPEPKAAQDETPNYDNLADNLNLKGLVELENQRNTDFSEKVLKNPEFLAEAKEAAKKYIPEATIKQMGDSPEFNDILTEGARKVEQRINDAVTFKPTVDEFNAIQGLVKQLPKGTVLDDINARTDSITDALASTSKTIQKNPELKELIRGAIDGFLKESAGQDLTVEMIEKLNKGLRPDEQGDFTLYKKETLTKENAVFSSPEASKIQLAETVAFINKAKADNIEPSVLAGLVYQRLIAYHPFAEGNGRMARVIVNKILLDAGYPPFTKFSDAFETQIIPQTNSTAKSATSSEVVSEFLRELGQKTLPAGSEPIVRTPDSESVKVQNVTENAPLVEPKSAETPVAESTDTAKKRETPINDKVQAKELVEKPRSLAQQIKDSFQPLRVGKKIKDVRESVAKYGGEVSFKFAQSKGEVFNEIIKHAETEHGACEATCAFWIAKKVNDDQSLFKEIYPEGKAGKLDKKAFEQIKKLQTDFINSGSSATQQFKFTESWLNEQGVNVKQKKVGEYSKKDEVSGTVTNKDVKALTKAILETGGDQAGVKKISINLQGGSHTVAAAVQGDKVVFFDPNFGEITFKSHQQFENWFKEAFWSKSGYAGTDSGKRFFNVINYDAK